MHFLKQDLEGQHYSWAEPNKGAFSGSPSRRLFDRFNGDQVLFIINCSIADQYSLAEARRMEQLINNYLPIEAKSEISVFNWLKGAE